MSAVVSFVYMQLVGGEDDNHVTGTGSSTYIDLGKKIYKISVCCAVV